MTINLEDLTIKQAKELAALFNNTTKSESGLSGLVGKKVIIRTYSAGVHFGILSEKSGTEVILNNSRRLYYWKTNNGGLSLSEVANAGLSSESKVCSPVPLQWLDAIEIIPCSVDAIQNIEAQCEYKA